MSSRYQMNRLWNGIAPILTTNLIERGVVDAASNESLTEVAVAAFDQYTNSTMASSAAASEVDASPANNRRRRRRPSTQTQHSSAINSIMDVHHSESSTVPTSNDNFFEYQRRTGYTLDNNHQSDDFLGQQLKETHIIDAIIYYLQHFRIDDGKGNSADLQQQRLINSIVEELQSGDSPALTVDLWATVQRGERAHHKFHVHEGVIVSGVYYSNCPLGCAPLVLRRPLLDSGNHVDCAQNDDDDAVVHPNNGQLVLFPPWLKHGVPLAKEQHREESSTSLPRVSWAFNLTVRLAYIGNAWDVTGFSSVNKKSAL